MSILDLFLKYHDMKVFGIHCTTFMVSMEDGCFGNYLSKEELTSSFSLMELK